MKVKDKKRQPKQSKKKQLLDVFHQTVDLLQVFTPEEMEYLQDRIHIFVFARGQCLAKEKQPIDYVGVVAEGRAVGRSRSYDIGDMIGQIELVGAPQNHPENITADSDGVLIALRIHDITCIDRIPLRNKIINKLAQIQTTRLLQRDEMGKVLAQYEIAEERKIAKYLTAEWTDFLGKGMDLKQKSKFNNYFPFYAVKQKDVLANAGSKPYLMYVVQGQVVAKQKQQQRTIETREMHNLEGFVLEQNPGDNVYCLSAEAVVLIIDKQLLQNNFKTETFRGVMRIVMGELGNRYRKPQEEVKEEKEGKDKNGWNVFKKYPGTEILPLAKKSESKSPTKQVSQMNESNLAAYQTLFREQLGNDGKIKTTTSMAESGYDKLFTLKTESQGKQTQSVLELQKLRKEVQLLSEKLKFTEEMYKTSRLELIQNKGRVAMGDVFKQIRKLHSDSEAISSTMPKITEGQGENLITFKQAFDKQVKQGKIQMLVAKCAFRWLYLTRKHKATFKKE